MFMKKMAKRKKELLAQARRELARLGGLAVFKKYGPEYFRALQKKGVKQRRKNITKSHSI